jgi:hypothetical protein
MHPSYTLGGAQPKIRDQEVKIDPEIAGSFDPATRLRAAKPLNCVLQPVHNLILALVTAYTG